MQRRETANCQHHITIRMTDYRQLVRDCLKGKPAAQRELYELFARPMLGVCYRYTKSVDDAEDILQDGFVKVFQNLEYRHQLFEEKPEIPIRSFF